MIAALALLWSAVAAEPGGPPLIDVLAVGEELGDGQTPITVHLLTLDAQGAGLDDLRARVRSRDAVSISEVESLGEGLYRVQVVPKQVDRPSWLELRIRGRVGEQGHKVDLRSSVPLRAPPPPRLELATSPEVLDITSATEATVLSWAEGRPMPRPEHLVLRASTGELGAGSPLPDGRIASKLSHPAERAASWLLLTGRDLRSPETQPAALVVPVTTSADLRVPAPQGTDVILELPGRRYGPFESRSGVAVVRQVMLEPGVAEARVLRISERGTEESAFQLPRQGASGPRLVPPPASIPADPERSIPLPVLVAGPDGAPDPAAQLTWSVDRGEITGQVTRGDLAVGAYRPPRLPDGGLATLEVRDARGARDRVPLLLTGTPTRDLDLSISEGAPGETIEVRARVLDGAGEVIEGREVLWHAVGARLEGATVPQADGSMVQRLRRGEGPFEVMATALTPPSSNPASSVVILPEKGAVSADGVSSVRMMILALDAYGVPVAHARLGLTLEAGDGSLPAQVQTDARGVGEVTYTAGRNLGLVKVRAHQPGMSATANLIQLGRSPVARTLPPSGSAQTIARSLQSAKLTRSLRVD
ncbi:MAG: hypothetical protein EA397_16385 [Deltaproteobacteria bacterium]|nr:MAG: hypothetical protein EA397_16385 [Deltaproteobacteria bacterium]